MLPRPAQFHVEFKQGVILPKPLFGFFQTLCTRPKGLGALDLHELITSHSALGANLYRTHGSVRHMHESTEILASRMARMVVSSEMFAEPALRPWCLLIHLWVHSSEDLILQ